MRSLKKLLAVIVAICVLATFTIPAFAADSATYANADKATKLNSMGLYAGISTTSFDPDLGSTLTREQGMVILLKMFGQLDAANAMTDADTDAALAAMTDASQVSSWAKKAVAYVLKNSISTGTSATTFEPKGTFTGNQFATLILKEAGFTVADWTTAAADLTTKGVAGAGALATTVLTRDDLVGMAFGALTVNNAAGKTIVGALVDAGKVTAASAEAAGVYTAAVTATAAVTGAKILTVTFNQAVDTTKAVITVKKGTVAVNTDSIEFAADKKSAVITTTTNLTKGDYTISVSGLTTAALTATVTAEDVKVAKINITSPKAPREVGDDKQAVVSYQVLNQYGEKMTGQGISWTISTGVGAASDTNTSGDGTFLITAANAADFVPGAIVYITGVHASSGTVVNTQVEIALASQADAVVFKGVYSLADSKLKDLPAGFDDGDYVLLFDVMDQYGNKIEAPDLSKLVFTSNNPLFVSSDTANGAFDQAGDVTIGDTTYTAVDLNPGTTAAKGGSVTVQAISTVTGKISTFAIQAEAAKAVKSFSMSAPAGIIAEGEDVELPFTALDQYGNAVTKFDDLTGITFSPNGDLRLVQKDDGTAKLMYQAPAAGASKDADLPVYLTSLVTDGGNFSSLMVYVKDTAVPTSIAGVKADSLTTSIARNNHVDLVGNDFIVLDQYGRTISDDDVDAWLDDATNAIVITSVKPVANDVSPFTVGSTDTAGDTATQYIGTSTDEFTLAAKDADGLNATEKITAELSTDPTDATKTIASSAKTITLTEVQRDAYASYKVDDLGTMYNDGVAGSVTDPAWDKTVAVYGVLASGTEVALPASDFTVESDSTQLDINNDVISDINAGGYDTAADFTNDDGDAQDVTVNALVTVFDRLASDPAAVAMDVLEKTLTVSNDDPAVKTVTFTDDVTDGKATIHPDDGTHLISAGLITDFVDEVKDQYGVDVTNGDEVPVITITGLVKADGSEIAVTNNGKANVSIAGQALGDKFTATLKYNSDVSVKIIFTVGLEE